MTMKVTWMVDGWAKPYYIKVICLNYDMEWPTSQRLNIMLNNGKFNARQSTTRCNNKSTISRRKDSC